MSELKCPFCQQELEIGGVDGILRGCPKCRNLGTEILWQELIRTRKALDVAIRRLDQMTWGCDSSDAEDLLKQIKETTALEQKA